MSAVLETTSTSASACASGMPDGISRLTLAWVSKARADDDVILSSHNT